MNQPIVQTSPEGAERSIAWDGAVFPVPADWDLSGYESRRRVTSMTLEDSAEVRLQIEWACPSRRDEGTNAAQRHAALADGLAKTAETTKRIADAPAGWTAFSHRFHDGAGLITALHAGDGLTSVSVFALFHGADGDGKRLSRLARRMMAGFRYSREGPIAWRAFDMALRMPCEFRLTRTSFLAGRKLLVFERRLRRLLIWRLSLADRLLRGRPPAQTVAEWLNKQKELPGARFVADPNGQGVHARRRADRPLGHAEEIGRWCFRYHVSFRLHPKRNALTIMVFHHRRESDLPWIDDLVLDDEPA